MLLPTPMLRLVWFVPEPQAVAGLLRLAETGQFHAAEARPLCPGTCEAQLGEQISQLLQQRGYQRLRNALQRLPPDPLLHYHLGRLPEGNPVSGVPLAVEGDLVLWIGRERPYDIQPLAEMAMAGGQAVDGEDAEGAQDKHLRWLAEQQLPPGRVGPWVIIDGWIPAEHGERFSRLLAGERYCLVQAERAALPLTAVPSRYRRPAWLDGFASLVTLYGTPPYRQLDPTLFVACSFTLLFGAMFADLGQGLLLVLAGSLLIAWPWKRPRPEVARRAGLVLVPVGGSAAFFGLLFGTAFAREDWIPALLFHPMAHITDYLLFCVGLGAALLTGAMLCAQVNARLRQGLPLDAAETAGNLHLLFYLAGLLAVAGYASGTPLLIWVGALTALVALVRFGAGRMTEQKSAGDARGLRAFAALLECYDLVMKFVVQTLSFVRVAAFTFAHIALSMALMVMVGLLGGHPLLALLLFVFGNLLITLIEGLLVAIQVTRLHFYEVFTKFIAGQGTAFHPWRLPEEIRHGDQGAG